MAVRSPRGTPAERFRSTNGRFLGAVGLLAVVALVVFVAVTESNLRGFQIFLGLAIAGMLIWMVLLRPAVTAYPGILLLRNMLSDTELPLARIDSVVVRHALNVWAGERRYVNPAIGRSSRSMLEQGRRPVRSSGPGATFGDPPGGQGHAAALGIAADYPTFVEQRIRTLAKDARRDAVGEPPPVRRTWAVPEIAVVVVLALVLAGTLVL